MSGKGRIVLRNRLTYDGEWREGKCHGKGQCRYHSGDKFIGDYRGGKRCGFGRMVKSDGHVLEGTWAGSGLEGQGSCSYPDKGFYQASFSPTVACEF